MRVALVGPDLEENLSLRYLAAALREAGHEPQIVAFETAADLPRARAAAADADLVGLSVCYQVRAPEFLALAELLKQDQPQRDIILGGHYASCAAQELLTHHPVIDAVVIHEGEHTLVELASLPTRTAETLATVPGIVYRATDGAICATAPRKIVADLDTLPWAERGPARLVVGVPTAYVMGSRGCLSSCDYCAINTLHRLAPGKRFRQRDPDQLVEELSWLYHERGVRQFVFHDDNFLVPNVERNLARIEALEQALRRHGMRRLGLVLKCRPPEVDVEVFRRLRELGLLRVFLGIESGSSEGLASLGRRQQTVDEAHRALEICAQLGISTQYTMITFHPEATPQTMRDDLAFVRRHIDHPLSFCRAEAYAGTPLEQRMIDAGRAQGDYLARSYDYSDATTALIWQAGRKLLHERFWSPQNLLGQSIQLDHLAAVYRHFYEGRDVDELVGELLRWQHELNSDSVRLFAELIDACEETPDLTSAVLQRRLRELGTQEAETSRDFLERACAFRAALRSQSYEKIGLSPTQPVPARAASIFSRIPRHAAAVVLALGLAGCGGDGGTTKHDMGVIEAPPPPMDQRIDKPAIEDMGVIEAPPPPMDLRVDQPKEDMGVIEAPPPPMDAGKE